MLPRHSAFRDDKLAPLLLEQSIDQQFPFELPLALPRPLRSTYTKYRTHDQRARHLLTSMAEARFHVRPLFRFCGAPACPGLVPGVRFGARFERFFR